MSIFIKGEQPYEVAQACIVLVRSLLPIRTWSDLSVMVKMIIRSSIILTASFVLAADLYAGTVRGMDNIDRKVVLDINSNGKTIELKAGDEIQIELESAGGTGYWWYFDRLDYKLIDLSGKETRSIGDEGKEMTGRPVIGVWKFRAKKPGRGIIRMKYYRAWEKSDKATKQFEINVDIKP